MRPLPPDDDPRATILAATLARLDAERLKPPPTPYPTTREATERRNAGLDEWGDPRPRMGCADVVALVVREAS